jgi:hypothetical protein
MKFTNLFMTFLKTLLYVLGAMLIRFLIGAIASFHPEPGIETTVWGYVIPVLAALIKLITRWINYDPAKAGK